jgi:hypothetical protein
MTRTDLEVTANPPDGEADGDQGKESPKSRRHRTRRHSRRFRIVVLLVACIAIAWIAVAAVVTFMGLRDASRAMHYLNQAKAELSASQVETAAPEAALRQAEQQFSDASGLLDSPLLSPETILPVVGRQITSVRDLAHAASRVSAIGVNAVSQLRSVIDSPHTSGPARVTALNRLAILASTTDRQLSAVNPGPSSGLLSPVASRYNQFVSQVQQVKTRLDHASVVAGSLGRILEGPSQYLLLVANNAEMRSGSGMFLQAGTLTFSDGHVKMSNLEDTGSIEVPKGTVPVSGDLAARWGWLDPTQDWRNLGLTPNFDEIGPVAVSMWKAVKHQQVDGVIMIDVEALQQLLQVTGPVTLADGRVVSSSGVVQLLMHDQYEDITFFSPEAQIQRESLLGSLAKATLQAIQDRSLDLKTLATAMSQATSGRHILMWSSDPSAESAWEAGGVSGELSNNSLLAAVVSRSGTKLDQYLSVSSSLSISTVAGTSEASLAVTLDNQTPPGQSPYIAGPYPHLGTVYGEYVGFLAVNLPADANSHFYATGATGPPVAWGAEGPVWVLAVPIDVKAGRREAVTVHFVMPGTHGQMTVVPSARIPPESWSFRGRNFTDATPETVSW